MYKLVLPAKQIPDGSVVTKMNGQVFYNKSTDVKMYDVNGNIIRHDLCEKVVALFKPGSTTINLWDADKELIWHVDFDTLQDYLLNGDLNS